MSKLAIVGGSGGLGSTMGFFLGLKGYFDHISLVGSRLNTLETHLIDLRECFGEETTTTISGGGIEELDQADLIIMTAAITREKVSSRDEYLKANLDVVRHVARAIKERAPKATIITCTAPVDAYVMVFLRELGWDRHRLLGFSRNDSQRFRHMVSKVTGLKQSLMGGMAIGEHGKTLVPLFSSLTYEGRPLTIKDKQKSQVNALLNNWYRHWQAQNSQRTTTWTSATGVWRTIQALNLCPRDPKDQQKQPMEAFARPDDNAMGSVSLQGEYGLSDVALGLPITPGPQGWGSVIELDLWPEELDGLRKSSEKVKKLYQSCS
jgi:malate/lactate dehydrogenase